MEGPRVVYEDERLLAVDKPSGRLVIPGRGDGGEALNAELSRRLGRKLFVVHRLDREASGLVLFAKDAQAHKALCALFETRAVEKTYLALVLGTVGPDEGAVERPLRAFGSGRMGVSPGGKPSLTRFSVRQRLEGAALLQVEPETGRRHQIRVHLHALGHPILGDPLYGKERPVGGAPRLMLHAWKLSLPAPFNLELKAELPSDFRRELEKRGGAPNFS